MTAKNVTLVDPTLDLRVQYLEMAEEFLDVGEEYVYHRSARADFAGYVAELIAWSQGVNLQPGWVPMTSYWLVGGGQVLGEIRLRHRLTPELEVEGGHIGYAVRPSARRKGYGTLMLSLVLEKARARGMRKVLVTCDTDNIGSARVIENNGGVLHGTSISPDDDEQPISLYWIKL